jgi:hypothetical protein
MNSRLYSLLGPGAALAVLDLAPSSVIAQLPHCTGAARSQPIDATEPGLSHSSASESEEIEETSMEDTTDDHPLLSIVTMTDDTTHQVSIEFAEVEEAGSAPN